jgi:hypothetical protein
VPGDTVTVTVAVVQPPASQYDVSIREILSEAGFPNFEGCDSVAEATTFSGPSRQQMQASSGGVSPAWGQSESTVLGPSQIALIYIGNNTQDQFTFIVACNSDSSQYITGATAEWIVERPTYPHDLDFETLYPLGAYGEMLFTNVGCGATVTGSVFPLVPTPYFGIPGGAGPDMVALASGAQPSCIVDPYGNCVSTGELLFPGSGGGNMVRVYQPYAVGDLHGDS